MNFCCTDLKNQIEYKCNLHENPFDCPDKLIYYSSKQNSFGLIIHDGGSSFIKIHFCPFCGHKF